MSEDTKKDKKDVKAEEKEVVDSSVEKSDTEAEAEVKKEEQKPSKEESKEKLDASYFSDIFITEDDRFDVTVKYYRDGPVIVVDTDDDFDKTKECKELTVTFKNPSQGDAEMIDITGGGKNIDTGLNVREVLKLELARVLVLIRGWSINKPISNESVMGLHPRMIKALTIKLRDIIGMDGII